ncbi:MAG: tRNA (adenosine(37)-N6)-dimethylallyltransferase MiaA [Balneolaceae bacterium]|nr:MAG: tRNA (adenosine(37)-N6)-dimethylallyltransferase MiaA [Balneolaceae bacterium]
MIAGPTASGKTTLSIALAEAFNGEIISVDSRQCYRYMDIGTAKPTAEELRKARHYNISILNPDEEDTVADFLKRAENYAQEIESRGKRVIYCGGSTLHLQSIIRPLDDVPPADPGNIERLNRQAELQGLETLFHTLQEADPDYAQKMDGLNRQRIIRALDVWHQTGKPFSSFHSNEPINLPGNLRAFALHLNREDLHQRISIRVDRMLEMGLLNEVRGLIEKGYTSQLQALNTVGYRQAISFLMGECSYDDMAEDIKTATRRYAKRQITWLRRLQFLHWLDMNIMDKQEAIDEISSAIR